MATCFGCRHYYVTWDPNRPHGCRAMGFKSRMSPDLVVRRCSGGMACQMVRPKSKSKGRCLKTPRKA